MILALPSLQGLVVEVQGRADLLLLTLALYLPHLGIWCLGLDFRYCGSILGALILRRRIFPLGKAMSDDPSMVL